MLDQVEVVGHVRGPVVLGRELGLVDAAERAGRVAGAERDQARRWRPRCAGRGVSSTPASRPRAPARRVTTPCSSASAACPRPRRRRGGASRRTRGRRTPSSRGRARRSGGARSACMPSMKPSSEPVESRITRTPVRRALARARGPAPRAPPTALRLSFAPGHHAAGADVRHRGRRAHREEHPAAPQPAPAEQPPEREQQRPEEDAEDDRDALVRPLVQLRRELACPMRGSAGWNTSPLCAASWWAMKTTVRVAVAGRRARRRRSRWGDAAARRRNHSHPPLTSS